ncbi:MAG: U32 family peptidase [Bacteroidales bacterium]|nr:U32 family peptidase [Bacteroidales bacterium]
MQIKLELLAPAKNKEIGIAAIGCGADSVYIAGPKFGAREAAGNSFTEVAELCSYAGQFGAKVYITVNTILFNSELPEAKEYVWRAYEAGCKGIIVQDFALLKMKLPPIPLFASTQTDIRTPEKAAFLEALGFKRLILARELSLEQIKSIRSATKCQLEFFVHGALCVCYSGQCYLSKYLTGRSANRGECAQPCRSDYTLENAGGEVIARNKPLLSLKDYNLSNHIGDLASAGITSFKIEGRLKNISYVRNIVRYYDLAINNFIEKNNSSKNQIIYSRASRGICEGGFEPNPDATFNRSYTQLYINGKRGEWNSSDGAKYIGEPIGKVTHISYNRDGLLQFKYNGKRIVNGDGLCIKTPSGQILGVRANSCKGNLVTTNEIFRIFLDSTIYRNYNFEFEKELEKNLPQRFIHYDIAVTPGEHSINIKCARPENEFWNFDLAAEGSEAEKPEFAKQNIIRQLSKNSGAYKFNVTDVCGNKMFFYSAASLNGVRRMLAEKIATSDVAIKEKSSANFRAAQKLAAAALKNYSDGANGLTYMANSSNKLSGEVYKDLGFSKIAPAFELQQPKDGVLMRTKYCIRYQFGMCKKKLYQKNEKLYLLNGKNRLELEFDCTACEMLIKKSTFAAEGKKE